MDKIGKDRNDKYDNGEEMQMKITAGLGSIDEYERFVHAGADEFFCGYVPYEWTKKYGTVMPLNRREVLSYNVQIGSLGELEILAAMVKEYGKPVHLTFNALYYIPEQYPEIAEMIKKCMRIGFDSYIIADPALILYLRKQHIDCEIHLSGETAEVNTGMVDIFQQMKLKRVIFHRKNTIEDMKSVMTHVRRQNVGDTEGKRDVRPLQSRLEFEAFALNELCQFTGAFCNSLHCDEMGYLCRVPYLLTCIKNGPQRNDYITCGKTTSDRDDIPGQETPSIEIPAEDDTGYLPGVSGCGLCALYRLKEAGITHLKLVGRGNYTDFMEKDIRNLRRALDILKASKTEKDYINSMKKILFPYGCSGNCYYRQHYYRSKK